MRSRGGDILHRYGGKMRELRLRHLQRHAQLRAVVQVRQAVRGRRDVQRHDEDSRTEKQYRRVINVKHSY